MNLVQLADVASINPRRPAITREDDKETSFVPMESIDDILGEVLCKRIVPYSKVKKGYTYFEDNDVIFAKITPCMQNGKHAVVNKLIDGFGFGSTEFHVIRPSSKISSEWIHFFLRRKETIDAAMKTFTGAVGQQRVPASFLENLQIPLPSFDKQRQIAARLKAQLAEVEKARQAAEAQLREANALGAAIQREIENELFSNSEIRQFGSYVKSYRNGFGKRPKVGELGPIVLRIADVSTGSISIANPRLGEVSEKEAETYKLEKGDLIFIRVNGAKEIVGKCCVVDDTVPEGTIFNDHLIRVQVADGLNPDFARLCVSLPRARLLIEEVASTSAGQLTINQQLLDRLEIPVYSIDEQIEFTSNLKTRLDQLAIVRETVSSSLADITCLPQKILAQAFGSIQP